MLSDFESNRKQLEYLHDGREALKQKWRFTIEQIYVKADDFYDEAAFLENETAIKQLERQQ